MKTTQHGTRSWAVFLLALLLAGGLAVALAPGAYAKGKQDDDAPAEDEDLLLDDGTEDLPPDPAQPQPEPEPEPEPEPQPEPEPDPQPAEPEPEPEPQPQPEVEEVPPPDDEHGDDERAGDEHAGGEHDEGPTHGEGLEEVETDPDLWRSDPQYEEDAYDPDVQLDIYRGKYANPDPRPPLELWRRLYDGGELPEPGPNFFGDHNPVHLRFTVFGAARLGVAWNDNGRTIVGNQFIDNNEFGIIATRVFLNFDLQLTATERIHLEMQPLENRGGDPTRVTFGGHQVGRPRTGVRLRRGGNLQELEGDYNPQSFFFEGDLGAIISGFSGSHVGFDMPFTFGLIPLFFQNGIWVDDAMTGAAFTIPAMNSAALDISNMDITFFAAADEVDTAAIRLSHDGVIAGVNMFVEMWEGYWEIGYGFTADMSSQRNEYHNVAVAFTRRYGRWLSNSVRVIANFGQDPKKTRGNGTLRLNGNRRSGQNAKTAEGIILLVENSLVVSAPQTLVPYFNFFIGYGKPQSLARDNGGILKNTGINFETDALTGFPKLDDRGANSVGGAIGVEYLFSLDQQIVVEIAGVHALDKSSGRPTGRVKNGGQLAFGVRYQRPFLDRFIVRAQVMGAAREFVDDVFGCAVELQAKF